MGEWMKGAKNSDKIQNRMGNPADGEVGEETRQGGGVTARARRQEGLVRKRDKDKSGAWFEG